MCKTAESKCESSIVNAMIGQQNFDVYDVRSGNPDPYPPETYLKYITRANVMKAIGAQGTFAECGNAPYNHFASTGDGKL